MSSNEGYPPPPQQQYAPPPQYMPGRTRRVIKRIDVMSAAKVSAVATGLITAVFGLFFVLLFLCGVLSAISSLSGNNGATGAGAVGILFLYVIAVVIYTIMGFIVGALYAWIYNMTSSWIGGLEVEVE